MLSTSVGTERAIEMRQFQQHKKTEFVEKQKANCFSSEWVLLSRQREASTNRETLNEFRCVPCSALFGVLPSLSPKNPSSPKSGKARISTMPDQKTISEVTRCQPSLLPTKRVRVMVVLQILLYGARGSLLIGGGKVN